MVLQYSLMLRYTRGLIVWRQLNKDLAGPSDFFVVSAALEHSKSWVDRTLCSFVSHLGLDRGQFRVEYATDLLRENEDTLWRTGFVKFAAGSMMILGLGGTFCAFITLLTTSGLMEALNGISTGQGQTQGTTPLITAFGNVFYGFGHAFVASLAGLITTTAIGFLNFVFVDRLRARFLMLAVTSAHKWESHLRSLKPIDSDEAYRPKLPEPLPEPPDKETPSAEQSTELVAALKSLVTEMAASHERWSTLANAVKDSHTYFASAVAAVREEGDAQRKNSRELVADMVSKLTDLVAQMVKNLEKVSAVKAEHLASVNNAIAQDVKVRQDAWEGVLKETLKGFGKTADEMVTGCSSVLTSNGQTALQASERVAQAVSAEAKAALTTVQEAVAETVKNQDRITEGQAAMQAQSDRVIQSLADHAASLQNYIGELSESASAWKDAPANFQAAFNHFQEVIREISMALRETSKVPGQMNKEMAALIDVMRPVSEKAKKKSGWANVGEQSKNLAEWIHNKLKS